MLRFGLGIALAVALGDRVVKWLLIDVVDLAAGAIAVTPFFNLVMVWNTGVSFGLLQDDWAGLPWLLSAIALLVSAALGWWLARVEQRWVAAALGLVIGGALGNVIDRLAYRAVADFFDFHLAGFHWPAFNVADSAIVIGVALLLIDGLFAKREKPK